MEFVRHLVAKGFIGEEAVQIVQSKRDPQPMKLACGLLDIVKDHLVMRLPFVFVLFSLLAVYWLLSLGLSRLTTTYQERALGHARI